LDRLRRPKRFSTSTEDSFDNIPDNLWAKCTRCHELCYVKELEKTYHVCPKCGYHFPLSAQQRIAQLLDPDSFVELLADLRPTDPLNFVAMGKPYREKLAEEQQKTGLPDAAVCGLGKILGHPTAIAVLDFRFLGASMGSVVGEKIARIIEEAIERRLPLVIVSASGGARMHEGVLGLLQMAKTASALVRFGEHRLPFISVLTDPTSGGVMASFASLGDVIIAEPGAFVGFAGPRVVEQITRQKLPQGLQTAEFAMEHGMIDMVVHRRDLRQTIGNLLSLYGGE